MKIVVFSPFYPPHIGGLESHSDEFNRHLRTKGVEICVYTPRLPEHAPEHESRHKGVEILRFPAVELIHNYPVPKFWDARFWNTWSSLLAVESDLVISRTRFFFTSLMAWRYARRRRIPWAHVEHGSDFAQFNSTRKTWLGKCYDRVLGRFVLRASDLNIANSEASRRFVEMLSGRRGCVVIYRGVDIERIERASPDTDLQARLEGRMLIGYVGRLIDGKGVHDLVEAFAELEDPGAALVIVGDGPERPRLERMVRELDIADRVFLAGHLEPSAALACMACCDVVVNPSYTEGLPSAIVEAALLRKAIIATDVGGTREIIDGNGDGYLVAPKDPAALTEKLRVLLRDGGLRRRFGDAAFAKAKSRFDWPNAVGRYCDHFEALSQRAP